MRELGGETPNWILRPEGRWAVLEVGGG